MRIRRNKKLGPLIILVAASFLLGACQTAAVYTSDVLKRPDDSPKIVVMPIDVELSELNAGGVTTPRADWSKDAKGHMEVELSAFLANRDVQTILYVPESENIDPKSKEVQLSKLFGAVGGAVAFHHYNPPVHLPTKSGKFDWTLGPDVQVLAKNYDADYALFTYVRDSYATAGRAAVIVFAAILGAHVQGGVQFGYASLVDLRTGEIVWFNRLLRASGDLRSAKRAKESVDSLLAEFPK